MTRPERKASSIAVWTSANRSSVNASRAGIPRPSLGESARSLSLAHSRMWAGPRNRAIAGIATPIGRRWDIPSHEG